MVRLGASIVAAMLPIGHRQLLQFLKSMIDYINSPPIDDTFNYSNLVCFMRFHLGKLNASFSLIRGVFAVCLKNRTRPLTLCFRA